MKLKSIGECAHFLLIYFWAVRDFVAVVNKILFLFPDSCQSSEMLVIFKDWFCIQPPYWTLIGSSAYLWIYWHSQDEHTVCNICSFITSHLILTNSYYCCCYYDYWKSYISISRIPTNRDSKHCLMSDLLHWVWCFLCILVRSFIKVREFLLFCFPEGI